MRNSPLKTAIAALTTAAALTLAPAQVSATTIGGKPCSAGQWTFVLSTVNPFWPVAPRVYAEGTSSFKLRYFSGGPPFYYESGLLNATWSDVLIPPTPYASVEILCTTGGSFWT
ncbi:hypothetical protein [Nonomuraea turkmeniaca]|nr:hypothetical protein [Nonomuraea turkmeniaca]